MNGIEPHDVLAVVRWPGTTGRTTRCPSRGRNVNGSPRRKVGTARSIIQTSTGSPRFPSPESGFQFRLQARGRTAQTSPPLGVARGDMCRPG
jgi:hypothetical protein